MFKEGEIVEIRPTNNNLWYGTRAKAAEDQANTGAEFLLQSVKPRPDGHRKELFYWPVKDLVRIEDAPEKVEEPSVTLTRKALYTLLSDAVAEGMFVGSTGGEFTPQAAAYYLMKTNGYI